MSNCIPANPDISGIGVRTAIYAQNLLSFIPALWALWDGKVTANELDSIETQSMTILITAFAILVSAMVQALTLGLSNFHVAIILDLSWMNNTSTFIYFLLYIRHKTQAEQDDGQLPLEMKWSAWIRHIREALRLRSNIADEYDDNKPATTTRRRSLFQRFFTKFVLIIGSLHLSLMAAIGLWLWSRPASFGQISRPCTTAAPLLFGGVPIASDGLRLWSIIIYSMFLLPLLNLVGPTCGFLAVQIYWPRISSWYHSRRGYLPNHIILSSLAPIHFALGTLLVINVFFVIDIETTIRRSTHLRDAGDSDWTFGQTLALLLLLVPLRDLVETVLDRREAQMAKLRLERQRAEADRKESEERQKEEAERQRQEAEKQRQEVERYREVAEKQRVQREEDLRRAVRGKDVDLICQLVKSGVDPKIQAEDTSAPGKFLSPLGVVMSSDRVTPEMVGVLLDNGADPNLHVDSAESLLYIAVSRQKLEIAKLLVERKADVNVQGGEYGTALQAACRNSDSDTVKLLLKARAEVNLQGGYYGTALQAAAARGSTHIIPLLLQADAGVNIRGGHYGSALQAAAASTRLYAVRQLLDSGADVNLQGGEFGTALQAAAIFNHKIDIVELLLQKRADVNIQGGTYGTALQAAAVGGRIDIVQKLLDAGAEINIQGGKFGTALQAAALDGHNDVVQLLMKAGADVNIEGGEHGSALKAARYHYQNRETVSLLLKAGACEDDKKK